MTKTVSLFRIFFVALMMCATTLLGQSGNEITVTGKVIDDKGETVIGASILVKGTGTGVKPILMEIIQLKCLDHKVYLYSLM